MTSGPLASSAALPGSNPSYAVFNTGINQTPKPTAIKTAACENQAYTIYSIARSTTTIGVRFKRILDQPFVAAIYLLVGQYIAPGPHIFEAPFTLTFLARRPISIFAEYCIHTHL